MTIDAIKSKLGPEAINFDKKPLSNLLIEKGLIQAIQKAYANKPLKDLTDYDLKLISYANEIEAKSSFLLAACVAVLALCFFAAFIGAEVGGNHSIAILGGSLSGATLLSAFTIYQFLYKKQWRKHLAAEGFLKLNELKPSDIEHLTDYELSEKIHELGIENAILNTYRNTLEPFKLRLLKQASENKAASALFLIGAMTFLALGSIGELIGAHVNHQELLTIAFGSLGSAFALTAIVLYQFLYRKHAQAAQEALGQLQEIENEKAITNLAYLRQDNPHDGLEDPRHPSYQAPYPGGPKNYLEELRNSRADFARWHSFHEAGAKRAFNINCFLGWFFAMSALCALFTASFSPHTLDWVIGTSFAGIAIIAMTGNYFFKLLYYRENAEKFKRLLES